MIVVMLSLFPSLLDFALLAPFILRLVVGVYFLSLGGSVFSHTKMPVARLYAGVCAVTGALLTFGLFVQGAAFAGLALLLLAALLRRHLTSKPTGSSLWLSAGICASLLFLGAGAFSFDLPL